MRLMVIDDDEDLAEVYKESLHEQGHEVFVYHRTADALEAYQRNKLDRPFEYLITDMRMPGGNGVEFIQNIKASNPGQKFIMISAYADEIALPAEWEVPVFEKPAFVEDVLNGVFNQRLRQSFCHGMIVSRRNIEE